MIGKKDDGSSYRVLIVDDSMFVRRQMERMLTAEGFTIAGKAAHGREAVSKYEALFPDVDIVTMDITMPGMHGVDALKEIKKIDPEACVIIVSALGRQDLMKEAFLSGAVHYIIKPINRDNLMKTMKYAIEGFT